MLREFKAPEGSGGNSLDPAYQKVIEAAHGYFQLEMWDEAWEELENLDPEFRHLPQVILLRILIFNNKERWEHAAILGSGALRHYPGYGPLYLATAHALRHLSGAGAAKTVLLAGESALKSEAIYHFMLACYESRLGELEDAKAELARAFELDKKLRLRALHEADLEPLWDSLGESR